MIQQTTTVPNTPGVSVIVCCYNSAKRLPETLRHLAQQQVPGNIPWEVIVINNASTDDTVETAKKEWQQYQLGIPFSIADQPKPGLSYARDKGFEKAQYEYCLFCDDDNWLDEYYIKVAYKVLEEHPEVGAVGGQCKAVFEITPPNWFEKLQGCYAVGKQGICPGYRENSQYLYGAGIVFRKSMIVNLFELGFKSFASGRTKEKVMSGEDVELCNAIKLANYKLWYEEKLIFQHYMPKERLSWNYIMKLAYCNGLSATPDVVYYFFLHGYKISSLNFIFYYVKRFIWLIYDFISKPLGILQYIVKVESPSSFLSYRRLYDIRAAILHTKKAFNIYRSTNSLRIKLENAKYNKFK